MIRALSLRSLPVLSLVVLGWAGSLRGEEDDPAARKPTAAQLEFFEKEVRPVLVGRCYECHAAESKKVRGGLRLDTREGVLKGGESGAVAIAGDPDESLLIQAVRYDDPGLRMPPDHRLPPREVEALEEWVRMGMPDPREGPREASTPAPAAAGITDEARRWWAFRPVREHAPPPVRDGNWPRNAVDRFVLAGLEAKGMRPAPEADRRTFIRRLTFDLTGLPPTPEEVEAFLADDAPDAYERWSIACWPRPTTASAGAGTGSTSSATPTPRAATATSPSPRPTATATTSSTASTGTSRTTSSSASRVAGDLLAGRPRRSSGTSRSSPPATWRSAAGSRRSPRSST